MKTQHDVNYPECIKNEPEKITTHSDGRIFYKCKNCNYVKTLDGFTNPSRISEIQQEPLQ